MQNAMSEPSGDPSVIARVAQRAVARREAGYADEVRRLLDAGLEVMHRCGTTSSPRVADIVQAAGLSNEAFYRHFASKEDLVAAIVESGAERLASYLRHQMGKDQDPRGQLRQRIQKALGELTARERMVFELRHYQGMKLRNIGEILGTSEEAAKNCLFRATQKMRVALGDFV